MANVTNSVGEMLRNAREKRNLTIEQANLDTKMSINVLKALEQDDFESFESDIYLKGFLRNYAKFLGINEREAMRTLERQRGGGDAAFSAPPNWDVEEEVKEEKVTSPRIFKRIILPILIGALVLLLILFLNERRKVRRLTTGSAWGYSDTEVAASSSVRDRIT